MGKRGLLHQMTFVVGILILTTAVGCSGKKKKSDADMGMPSTLNADVNLMGDSDSNQAMGLQTVRYAYDSHALSNQAKQILRQNTEILKSNPNVRIQVEGHTDERGTIQYNLALGERRANAARRYLIDNGISPDRITTISFGEERPADPRSNEEAWSKNRRSNFVITSR
jgi:peptidoglycan-associated lipoprotein